MIRNAEAGDAAQLTAWWNDGAVMAHAGWPNGLGTTEDKVTAELMTHSDDTKRRLMLEISNQAVGEMSYRNLNNGSVEIGIKICDSSKQEQNRDTHKAGQHPFFRHERVNQAKQDGNMQTGYRNDMTDTADLKGCVHFIGNTAALPQQQCRCKSTCISRHNLLHTRKQLPAPNGRIMPPGDRFSFLDNRCPYGICQHKNAFCAVGSWILQTAIRGQAEAEHAGHGITGCNLLLGVQVCFDPEFLLIEHNESFNSAAVVRFVAVI